MRRRCTATTIRTAVVGVAVGIGTTVAGCSDESRNESPSEASATTSALFEGSIERAPTSAVSPTPSSTASDDAGTQPTGFTTVIAEITAADGSVCEVCVWLADNADERNRGLMGVTEFGDPVGMAFVWDEATDSSFFMFATPTPLSIAWFGEGELDGRAVDEGRFVGSADMEPCLTDDAASCMRYAPAVPYRLAIEVAAGGLEALGIEPGSSVRLVSGSESPTCPPPV